MRKRERARRSRRKRDTIDLLRRSNCKLGMNKSEVEEAKRSRSFEKG